jgi:thioesterase domain-containing protein
MRRGDAIRFLQRRLASKLRVQRKHLAAQLGLAEAASEPSDPAVAARKRVFDASFRAAAAYRPRPYNGSAVLFRTNDRLALGVFREADPLNGWGELIRGGIHLENLPGDHWNIFTEPAVSILAEKTAAWVAGARRTRR